MGVIAIMSNPSLPYFFITLLAFTCFSSEISELNALCIYFDPMLNPSIDPRSDARLIIRITLNNDTCNNIVDDKIKRGGTI